MAGDAGIGNTTSEESSAEPELRTPLVDQPGLTPSAETVGLPKDEMTRLTFRTIASEEPWAMRRPLLRLKENNRMRSVDTSTA